MVTNERVTFHSAFPVHGSLLFVAFWDSLLNQDLHNSEYEIGSLDDEDDDDDGPLR